MAIGLQVDTNGNQSSGTKGTAKDSLYFKADGSARSGQYNVTLNYGTGHFCSCRGMISKIRKFGGVGGMNATQNLRLQPTERHHCKHIHAVRSADPSIRIEARKQRNEHFGIMETPTDPETGTTGDPVVVPTTGRKAAVAGSRQAKAERGEGNARERIAELEKQMDAMRSQIEIEDAIQALTEKHGADAVNGVVSTLKTEAA